MGKIYNGADMNAIESDKPKNIEEIVGFLKKIGSLVAKEMILSLEMMRLKEYIIF